MAEENDMYDVVAVIHDGATADRVLPVACALANVAGAPVYAVDVSVLSWLSNPECVSWMWTADIGHSDPVIEARCRDASACHGTVITLRCIPETPMVSLMRILSETCAQGVVIAGTLRYGRCATWRWQWRWRCGPTSYGELANELRRVTRNWTLTVVTPDGTVGEFRPVLAAPPKGGR